MGLTRKLDFEDAKFSLYFLALDGRGAESAGRQWAGFWCALASVCVLLPNGPDWQPSYE